MYLRDHPVIAALLMRSLVSLMTSLSPPPQTLTLRMLYNGLVSKLPTSMSQHQKAKVILTHHPYF